MRIYVANVILLGSALSAQATTPAAVPPRAAVAMRPRAAETHIKVRLIDITNIQGANANVIHGVGLVTGLKATGDSAKMVREAMVNFLRRSAAMNRTASDLATGNTAMVMVKATIPAFSKRGMLIDVTVSAINDANSLHGGMLEATALRAISNLTASGKVYGIATGRIFVNGASFGTGNVSETRNHPTVGTVLNGCSLSIAPKSFYLSDEGHLELRFLNPSIASVVSAVEGINQMVSKDGYRAEIVDQYMLRVRFPEKRQTEPDAVMLLNRIRNLPVATGQKARVIIDEATGMILAGDGVRISPCAFAVEDVHITIVSEDVVSQPGPGFNRGTTEIVNRTQVEVTRTSTQSAPAILKGGATVEELVRNLSALNLTAPQLIAVFTKLKFGGYLHAELEYR